MPAPNSAAVPNFLSCEIFIRVFSCCYSLLIGTGSNRHGRGDLPWTRYSGRYTTSSRGNIEKKLFDQNSQEDYILLTNAINKT
jgi:hypothetical protein